MPLYISSINSGSNGNCYYVGNDKDAVLVDAGISCRKIVQRMNNLGLSIGKVRGIFISHEHSDHTRGAEVLSRKYGIPVYLTESTWENSRIRISSELRKFLISGKSVKIGGLRVVPFPKSHDASDPHSFTISSGKLTIGVFTDIGEPCKHVKHHLGKCHAAFLETNYDEEMLRTGPYPVYLKQRIASDVGHLSNDQALELFRSVRSPGLKLLMLSHLSAENNKPEIVHELFNRHADGTHIEVASRYQESAVFCINGKHSSASGFKYQPKGRQLSLFEPG